MAQNLTPTLEDLSKNINKQTNMVLEIQDSQYLYVRVATKVRAKWDDPRIKWDNQDGFTWDGQIEAINSKPYIMTKGSETSKEISQQLLIEKGGAGSTTTYKIELVDYRGETAQDLSENQLGKIIGKTANLYSGLSGGNFPEDYVTVIRGYITDITYNLGSITVSLALATDLLRQSSFEAYQAQLNGAIDAIQTNIPVSTTGGLFSSIDSLTSYIRIDDEIMEVININANSIDVVRSALGTFPSTHDDLAEIQSRYQLAGNPLDIALKLLHSKEGNPNTETDITITGINRIDNQTLIDGAIITDQFDVGAKSGLVAGDIVVIPSGINAGEYTVESFVQLNSGKSYILVEESLLEENSTDYKLSTRSQFNVLPDGCGLKPDFVDTAQFLSERDLYFSNFIDYDIPLEDTLDSTKELITGELFRGQGLYLISRDAKASVKFTSPPFSVEELPVLDINNIENITQLKLQRASHKYFYNSILFKYNKGVLDDKFFDKLLKIDATSLSEIPVGRKRLSTDITGLKRGGIEQSTLDRIASALLQRYSQGAFQVRNIKVLYSVGIRLEIGDIVVFGGENTQITDPITGLRTNPIRQYEIVNRKLDPISGTCTIDILSTGDQFDGIFGVYSPSSKVADGSTVDRILLDRLWDTSQFTNERDKWTRWIGAKIRVRSEDYTFDETVTLESFDLGNNAAINLSPSLSVAPTAGYVLELAKYDEYDPSLELDELLLRTYTFTMPSSLIETVTNDQVFTVPAAEISKYKVGMEVNFHSNDYSRDSETRIIDDITSNTITLNSAFNISIQPNDRLEVYGFGEDEKGYRILG